MPLELLISPSGHLLVREMVDTEAGLNDVAVARRVEAALSHGTPRGLLHLATIELQTALPAPFAYARDFASLYLTRLCQVPPPEPGAGLAPVPGPTNAECATWLLRAPPMQGLEYLNADVLGEWWAELDAHVRSEIARDEGGAQGWLGGQNRQWRVVGRVTFHLAENKRDSDHPFAFLATYASRLSPQGRPQYEPLGRALEQYAGAKNRQALLSLLVPIQRAAEQSALAKELVDSGEVYQPLAWTPHEAYRFLQDVPLFEASGLIVRVPDWWQATRPPRPVVSVKIDSRAGSRLDVTALLDFSVGVTLDGEPLTEAELRELLASTGGLVPLKGKWVELDRDKLKEALEHWKTVERGAREEGLSFFKGMRLLSGAPVERDAAAGASEAVREWAGLSAGPALEETLRTLRAPEDLAGTSSTGLQAELRPYQRVGANWLRFVTGLGLGACLADDMGLGKTVQVIALLLEIKRDQSKNRSGKKCESPSLLVVPASLIANWKAELTRFAPSLKFCIAHPSETPVGKPQLLSADVAPCDLVITTYGMLSRIDWLRERRWHLAILDEAQAIKNAGTRQTRAVKNLHAAGRIAMTGTPVENRLSDLWSLFDFLNPGLLGSGKAFADFVKQLSSQQGGSYQPLRTLVQPYILRRLKTDKRVIADLPEKTEVRAFCGLSRQQAALYEHTVRDLAERLKSADGIQRRGLVLAQLMRLKQICNHPAQLTGTGAYEPAHSSKFQRLAELCEELAARQEKALVFTQFREIAEPLAKFLAEVFGRTGLVLHGGTTVANRRTFVEDFQREGGPPYFVLSLKAGGTGLNLTAASHVIHFDRWWNPAVENQATDRAFRIGQKRNVLVHKFVCRGTVEERIDELISQKSSLADEILEGAETLLTEMSNDQLLKFVGLDVSKALDS